MGTEPALTVGQDTPARRPESKIIGVSPIDPSVPAWTSSRSHRLLRPISAAISSIRKHQYEVKNARTARQAGTRLSSNTELELPFGDAADLLNVASSKDDQDPEWAPDDRPSKRTTRTYGTGRRALKRQQRIQSRWLLWVKESNIDDAENFKGLLSKDPPTSQHPAAMSQEVVACAEDMAKQLAGKISKENFRSTVKEFVPTRSSLYEGLFSALENLLVHTSRRQKQKQGHSLFEMCLRAVPKRIELDEALELAEDPDTTTDMSDLIYNELEAYGGTNGRGWKHLRVVTRAHGVHMLGSAIKERMLHPMAVQGFIQLCYREQAVAEAETLADAFLSSMKPLPHPAFPSQLLFDASTSEPMLALRLLWVRARAWSNFFPALTRLLQVGTLTAHWMASLDMAFSWSSAVGSIIAANENQTCALDLLRTTVLKACWPFDKDFTHITSALRAQEAVNLERRSDALLNDSAQRSLTTTISNLLISLVSAGMVCFGSQQETGVVNAIAELFQDICQIRNFVCLFEQTPSASEARRMGYVTMASILLSCWDAHNDAEQNRIDNDLYDSWIFGLDAGASVNDLSTFVCSIASCCERFDGEAGISHVRQIVDFLLERSVVMPWLSLETAKEGRALSRLAVEIALEYAERTSRQADLDWALELEDLHSDQAPKSSPSSRREKPSATWVDLKRDTGFRWEDGIGEWVERTPAMVKFKLSTKRAFGRPPELRRPLAPVQEDKEQNSPIALPQTDSSPERELESGTTLLDLTATPARPSTNGCDEPHTSRKSPSWLTKPIKVTLESSSEDEDELSWTPSRSPTRNSVARRDVSTEESSSHQLDEEELAHPITPKPVQREGLKRKGSAASLAERTASDSRAAGRKRRRTGLLSARHSLGSRGMRTRDGWASAWQLDGADDSEDELGRDF